MAEAVVKSKIRRSSTAPINKKAQEFARVANLLKRRIEFFTSLPIEKLDRLTLQKQARAIGKS